MYLYLLRHIHHNGQTFYGVFNNESEAKSNIAKLKIMYPNVPESHYIVERVELNKLTEIEPD